MERTEFLNAVKDILNHLSDPAYLENHNLINIFYHGEETSLSTRVQALRTTIQESIDILKPPDLTPDNAPEWRCYKILTYRYFQFKDWYLIEEELGLSQRQVHRDLKKGLDALTSILWENYTSQKAPAGRDGGDQAEGVETYDAELIKEELKNWEISYDLTNLAQLLEQALQLCKTLGKTEVHDRVDMSEVDPNLNVMVDQVLTKQGLYKIFSMIGASPEDLAVQLRTRKLNDFFYEIAFNFNTLKLKTLEYWNIAQLFFTIQSLRHTIVADEGTTTISVILPVKKQISCLVIDDVASVHRLIERMLGSYGIQVFGADNYTTAINLIQLAKPDFILLDILMPKMDGWQMIKNIKTDHETRDIPVIICSVLYEPELSRAVNAAAYIRKPINRLELIQTLNELGIITAVE